MCEKLSLVNKSQGKGMRRITLRKKDEDYLIESSDGGIIELSDWDYPKLAVNFGWAGDGDGQDIPAAILFLEKMAKVNAEINDPGYFNFKT